MIHTKLAPETAAAAVKKAQNTSPASALWSTISNAAQSAYTDAATLAGRAGDTIRDTWSKLPDLTDKAPAIQKLFQQQAAQELAAQQLLADQNKRMSNALVLYGLGGLGAGLSGTKLYNVISSLNKPKDKYTKFGPGAKTIDDDEKIAADAPAATAPVDYASQIGATLRSIPGQVTSRLPSVPDMSDLSPDQQAFFVPALLATTGLGLYGGYSLMNAIYEHKRQSDRQQMVEDAKKEYQRALTGKRAEALDMAFATYQEKAAKDTGLVDWIVPAWNGFMWPLKQLGAYPLYTTALAGTGALAGKMTYDWTRERSKDKALERARKSRARLEGVSPVYIDPEQMVAISELAKKQKQKAQPEADEYNY